MRQASALYKLLVDEARLRLLRVLHRERFNVTELTGILRLAAAAPDGGRFGVRRRVPDGRSVAVGRARDRRRSLRRRAEARARARAAAARVERDLEARRARAPSGRRQIGRCGTPVAGAAP